MVKQKDLKKLTWKYFWEQKGDELMPVRIVLIVLAGAGSLILIMMNILYLCGVEEAIRINPWLFGICISYLSCLIIWGLIYWIKDNWEWATERAEEDLKKLNGGNK